jgi:four helix bundle protein
MAGVKCFEDLVAWQKADALVAAIRRAIKTGELQHDSRLCDQLLRAARSVASNVAEGFEANTGAEFNRFLGMARASCAEVRSLLYEIRGANLLPAEMINELFDISRSTANLVSALKIAVESRVTRK